MKLVYWIRCLIGKPICYRKYPEGVTDWYFAICKYCDRQSEVH